MRTPDNWQRARATVAIALFTALVFLVVEVMQPRWVGYGVFVPADWSSGGNFPLSLVTPLTTTLLHPTLLGMFFNLLLLLFCGRAVEGAAGQASLIILYVAGAYAAAASAFALDPSSTFPIIGASGAVSAVVGANAILFGRNRVRSADARQAMWLNALWMLAAWIALQVALAIVASGGTGTILTVAAANIGGFVAGALLARPLLLWRFRGA